MFSEGRLCSVIPIRSGFVMSNNFIVRAYILGPITVNSIFLLFKTILLEIKIFFITEF